MGELTIDNWAARCWLLAPRPSKGLGQDSAPPRKRPKRSGGPGPLALAVVGLLAQQGALGGRWAPGMLGAAWRVGGGLGAPWLAFPVRHDFHARNPRLVQRLARRPPPWLVAPRRHGQLPGGLKPAWSGLGCWCRCWWGRSTASGSLVAVSKLKEWNRGNARAGTLRPQRMANQYPECGGLLKSAAAFVASKGIHAGAGLPLQRFWSLLLGVGPACPSAGCRHGRCVSCSNSYSERGRRRRRFRVGQ